MKRKIALDFLIPILILMGLTTIFWITDADIAIQKSFYTPEKGWYLNDTNPWDFLYHHGNKPGLILVFGAVLILILGFLSVKLLRYRKIALFLIIFLIIGPGLITNTIFKSHWGRPRPRHIVEFGGKDKYLPVWVKGISGKGKSFPSGHASIGFFLFAPFFFLRNHAPKWAGLFLFLGIGYGTFMGIGRMVQGGHFPSDVVWAFGFTYLTGLILYYLFRFDRQIWWGAKE